MGVYNERCKFSLHFNEVHTTASSARVYTRHNTLNLCSLFQCSLARGASTLHLKCCSGHSDSVHSFTKLIVYNQRKYTNHVPWASVRWILIYHEMQQTGYTVLLYTVVLINRVIPYLTHYPLITLVYTTVLQTPLLAIS